MKDQLQIKRLYSEAFALIQKIQDLLLEARAQHEKDACQEKKAA